MGQDYGALSIDIGRGVAVQTGSDTISDMSDQTLLKNTSPLWEVVSGLQQDDTVRFAEKFAASDKDCIREESLTEQGSMSTPDFTMRFSSVTKTQ